MASKKRSPRSISISDELWDQVKEEAASTGQSISSIVVGALGTFFQSQTVRRSSWDVDDNDAWYDEHKFYTFSQDKFGHSAKVEFHIPKMIAGEIAGLIDGGKIPELRTPQDFYRNAIRHMAYKIGKWVKEGTLVEQAHIMTLRDRVAADEFEAEETAELIKSIERLMSQSIELGHYTFAENRLKYLWAGADSINERFKEQYMETLREYERRLKSKVKATTPLAPVEPIHRKRRKSAAHS